MPLHDWSRVSDNVFHAFHYGWMWNLARALNMSVLPAGYLARPEESLGGYEADVLTLETGAHAEATATAALPQPTLTIAPPQFGPRKERHIAVFSARDERRVAVIEIVSPGNKDSRPRVRLFEEKLLEYLEAGLHVVVVDLLPPSGPAPVGFPSAIVRAMGSVQELPPSTRHAASFECETDPRQVRVYVEALVLGEPLPLVPLFLSPGLHVLLPLEETYERTFADLSATDRARL